MVRIATIGKKSSQLSKRILASLYKAVDGGKVHIWAGHHYFDTYIPERKASAQVYFATVRRMKKQGWIEESKRQGKKFLTLTKKGKVQALLTLIEDGVSKKKLFWDGKWRLAIFDIPEEEGTQERYRIRSCLKACGFFCLQKSVYIHPHEIPEHVVNYLKESGLDAFIRFLRVDRMDNSKELEKRFQLRKR